MKVLEAQIWTKKSNRSSRRRSSTGRTIGLPGGGRSKRPKTMKYGNRALRRDGVKRRGWKVRRFRCRILILAHTRSASRIFHHAITYLCSSSGVSTLFGGFRSPGNRKLQLSSNSDVKILSPSGASRQSAFFLVLCSVYDMCWLLSSPFWNTWRLGDRQRKVSCI